MSRSNPIVAVEIYHGMTRGLYGSEDVAKVTFLGDDVEDAKQFVLRQSEFYGTISDYDYVALRRSDVAARRRNAPCSST